MRKVVIPINGPESLKSAQVSILISRDKASLDIFWLKDESLSVSDNLPDRGVLAREIVDDLEAALEQFREIAGDLERQTTQDLLGWPAACQICYK